MDEQNTHIAGLLEQFQNGTLSGEGMQELIRWYDSFENNPSYAEGISDELQQQIKQEQFSTIKTQLAESSPKSNHSTPLWPRIAVAASILIFLSVCGYLFIKKQHSTAKMASIEKIEAGCNKAELILADGTKILLDNTANGRLALQGSSVINKTKDGELVYANQGKNSTTLINTVRTPRGGQYHLVLADGTGVWLNAASSITYPSTFTGASREVQITGEVYFEVAHNAAKPFRVKSESQTVEVLGTHFNVNAYENESKVATTLLEGSVRVVAGNTVRIIKPGQQALSKGSIIKINQVDTDEAVAWKNGYFDFTNSDIRSVMRQVSRWYDVDVEFTAPVTSETFTGKIPRTFDLAKTIKVIELSNAVKLTVKGRRIMVK